MAKLTLSTKGAIKLFYNDFGYVKDRENEQKIRWRCDFERRMKCRAYAYTAADVVDGGVVELCGIHSHAAVKNKFALAVAKNNLKQKAKESSAPTSALVSQVVGEVSSDVAGDMVKTGSLMRLVRRYRSAGSIRRRDKISESANYAGVIPASDLVASNEEHAMLSDHDIGDNEVTSFPNVARHSVKSRQRGLAEFKGEIDRNLVECLRLVPDITDPSALSVIYNKSRELLALMKMLTEGHAAILPTATAAAPSKPAVNQPRFMPPRLPKRVRTYGGLAEAEPTREETDRATDNLANIIDVWI